MPSEQAGGIDAEHASRLAERWEADLDGAVIGSPLFVDGPVVPGAPPGVVYVSTQAGSVYALSAHDGGVLWQRTLGTAASTCAEPQAGVTASYGIVSTGAVDRGRGVLYVIGATGLLYALDLATGQTRPGWPLQIVSETTGELVWGGLTLAGDRLYVPVASYCDEPAVDGTLADGRLVAVDVDSARVVATFDVVPGPGNMGGIWGFGGASVDPLTGDLWTATGNSWVSDPDCGCIIETAGYGESVVQLDPALGVVAADRPPGVPGEAEDADFGGAPVLFQPPGCPPLAAVNSKNGFLYVWRRDSLATGPIWSAHVGPADLANAFIGEPSYSPELGMLIVSDARDYDDEGNVRHFDAVDGFAIGPGCTLPRSPTWITPDVGRGPKPPPLIVGDVAFVAGAYVPGLFALDATTGAVLWSTELGGSAFAPPAFADDKVIVGDTGGTVRAFGVGPEPQYSRHPLEP